MATVERVRIKPASPVAKDWKIPPESIGTVICRYSMPTSCAHRRDRLDVRFTPNIVIWGGPADDFEVVGDPVRTSAPAEN